MLESIQPYIGVLGCALAVIYWYIASSYTLDWVA